MRKLGLKRGNYGCGSRFRGLGFRGLGFRGLGISASGWYPLNRKLRRWGVRNCGKKARPRKSSGDALEDDGVTWAVKTGSGLWWFGDVGV